MSDQQGLETHTLYDRPEAMLKNYNAILSLSTLIQLVKKSVRY